MNSPQKNKPIFFWQEKPWQQLWQLKKQQRLPHALLFAGIEGLGKAQLALHFSQSLLCQSVNEAGFSCNGCHDCHLIATKMHPNMRWIETEESSQTIKIDQIRMVSDFINQSSLQGDYRIVVINLAHKMHPNAANALLKTLEEPSVGAIFILISHQPQRLPATILSRLCRINFIPPSVNEASAWLQSELTKSLDVDVELLLRLNQGAPLAALHFMEDKFLIRKTLYQGLDSLHSPQGDPIKLTAQLTEKNLLCCLEFILTWLIDLIRLQLGEETQAIINKDWVKELNGLKQQTHLKATIKLLEYVNQVSQQINSSINLNKQLLLESVLIRYQQTIDVMPEG